MSAQAPSVVERLAEWIVAVELRDVPERVRAKARAQTLSVVAAVHAGADTVAGQAVERAATRWGSPGNATVIPSGRKLGLHDAVFVNAALGMTLDYDDYLYMGHTGHSAVLASLAIAEVEGLDSDAQLLAQIVGNEIAGRVGASAVLGPQNGQAWSFIHAAGGAALASKLHRLSIEQTAHALAIALYQPTFTLWPGFMGPDSKLLTAAGPTVTGIQAAALAREGLTGAREIFEHPRKGFWASFTFAPLPHMMTGLGTAWLTDTLAYKRYPGCAYIDTTMDALFLVLADVERERGRRLAAEDVERIDVEASLLTVEMDNLASEHDAGALSAVNVNFSIPYNVGIGVVAGQHTAAEMAPAFLGPNEAAIRALAAKTTLRHDWEMSWRVLSAFDRGLGQSSVASKLGAKDLLKVIAGYQGQMGGAKKHSVDLRGLVFEHGGAALRELAKSALGARRARARRGDGDLGDVDFSRFEMAFPAQVTVRTTDGASFRARQDVPWGAPGQKEHLETAEAKFRREVGVHLPAEQVEPALAAITRIEERSIAEVMRLVCRR